MVKKCIIQIDLFYFIDHIHIILIWRDIIINLNQSNFIIDFHWITVNQLMA